MSDVQRLSRWILGPEQPTPYCLDLDHPAQDDIAWAADEIARLTAALEEYGNHHTDCESHFWRTTDDGRRERAACDCGFEQALQQQEQQ